MTKLNYTNQFGTVEMLGNENSGFSIYEIHGMELLGRERSLVNFHSADGYHQTSARFGQRVITISGDIKNKAELQRAISIFSSPGVLKIETDNLKREITVNDAVLKVGEQNGVYKKFAIQLTCDKPHFTDLADTISGIYIRKNLITAETVLPAVFTERSAAGIIRNEGDFSVEPIIKINSVRSIQGEEGNIIIENLTNGKSLVIEHTLAANEIVTVDIPNREIISNIAGNILNSLAHGSYLSDFKLDCGDNMIEVTASGGNRNAEVYVFYRNLYAGVAI